ncbi:acyl-CoA thioester hydrolase [Labilibaculum filiforme]|uniref:Acyl-CoA thioester hydrolase n=1 Tax=Labilibaculum filiforme TaxID=1940526 RepID=A0A2N3HT29_9BACT|nr:thioesterase family protein [Labilibaculum filiforme]PKQ61201.1 acyl-CoA thioester hydrolase [Labilibaculum filiforme]
MTDNLMIVEMEIGIKAYDIDAMGIVSNIVYIRWFEDLRHLFLEKHFPYNEMIATNISPILIKTEVHYKLPLTIHDHPRGICRIKNLGSSKWEMDLEIFSGDLIHCKGKQIGCFYNLEKQRPSLVPKRLLKAYEEAKLQTQAE